MTISALEPKESFPYKPPTEYILNKYSHIFEIKQPLPNRFFKTLFDKLVSLLILIPTIPILLILKIAYVLEGFIIPENKGPM